MTVNELHILIEDCIANLRLPKEPSSLYEPIVYGMAEGGKRLRPVLTLATAEGFGKDPKSVVRQGVALEMFHNFTLLHDDVMDQSPVRRGRPSVYAKWDTNAAILSGDTMLTLATEMMAQVPDHQLRPALGAFNRMALRVYEGQARDMDFETAEEVSLADYLKMISDKTSALLGCACRIGALVADASEGAQDAMDDFGETLGIAFQIQDDYLDVYGDPKTFGKPIGGDIANRKKTFLYINALALAPERVREAFAIEDSKQRYEAVRSLYDELGIPELCKNAIREYSDRSLNSLRRSGINKDGLATLEALASKLVDREK